MSLQGRLLQFSTCNDALSPLELASIRQELAIRTEAVARHRREAERLESECEVYKALSAPLRRISIPPEILGEIFLHVTLSGSPEERVQQLEALCLVCKTWKDAAMATPRLWVHLEVLEVENILPVVKIKTWLSRSGAIPKTLRVTATDNVAAGGCCPLNSFKFASYLVEGPALKSLSIECSTMQCVFNLLELVVGLRGAKALSWDSLPHLELNGGYEWGDAVHSRRPLIQPSHLPASLTSLKLILPFYDNVGSPQFLQPLVLPTLSELEIGYYNWPVTRILKDLKGCCNLKTLVLNFMQMGANYDGADGVLDPSLVTTLLPNVEILRLRQLRSRNSADTHILRLLECPCLTELDISYWNEHEEPEHLLEDRDMLDLAADVARFVRRSKCVESGILHRLRLHSLNVSSQGLAILFDKLYSIKHLILDNLDVDSFLCERMIRRLSLPRLEDVRFLNFPSTFDTYSFCRFVEQRRVSCVSSFNLRNGNGAQLSRIAKAVLSLTQPIKYPSDPHQEPYAKRVREMGVDLTVEMV